MLGLLFGPEPQTQHLARPFVREIHNSDPQTQVPNVSVIALRRCRQCFESYMYMYDVT